MPKILERLVKQLKAKGVSKASAYAIATKSLQKAGDLAPGSQRATSKGTRRGKMTPAARAKDRASKISKHPPSQYNYDSKTNRVRLK